MISSLKMSSCTLVRYITGGALGSAMTGWTGGVVLKRVWKCAEFGSLLATCWRAVTVLVKWPRSHLSLEQPKMLPCISSLAPLKA